jgi:hypothetical protein
MLPLYTPAARSKLIKDIAPPTIGDAISKSRKRKRITIPVRQASKPASLRLNKNGKITRVPPMPVMHDYTPITHRDVGNNGNFMKSLPWLPKKYTLAQGLTTDWHARAFADLKFAAPLLIGIYAFMLIALSWQLPDIPPNHGGGKVSATVKNASAAHSSPGSPTKNGNKSTQSSPAQLTVPMQTPAPTMSVTAPVTAPASPIDVVLPSNPITPSVPIVETTSPPEPTVEVPSVEVNACVLDVQTPSINL